MYQFKPLEFNRHFANSISRPEGRVSSTIYSNGNDLYIFGGMSTVTALSRQFDNHTISLGVSVSIKDTWSYNLSTKKWKLLMNEDKINLSDSLMHGIIGVMYEKNFLIICTFNFNFQDMPPSLKSCLHIYDLKNKNVLVHNTSGEIPVHSLAGNMIRHENFLYTVQLDKFGENNFTVYQLNTNTQVWKIVYKSQEFESRLLNTSQPTLVYNGKSIFVFGAHFVLDESIAIIPLNRIAVFDLKEFTWKMVNIHGDESQAVNFPEKRLEYNVAQYRNPLTGDMNVILTGGYSQSNSIYSDVWKLNLTSFKWKYLGLMPPEIGDKHSTTVSPFGQLIIFGGVIKNSNGVHTCSPAVYSIWLSIPKLENICWLAVLHYYPNLALKTKEEVMSLGISWEVFQSRVH
ncbi:GSCOCG00007792001-RA-CDS [Cotesia congregata]|nr:GSCOCG00007792001-RA-CDS [Cotesia congregata]